MNSKIITLVKNRGNFIIYSSLKILVILLGFVTNVIIVRELSINDYGIFSVILMLNGLITTFGFSWSSSSILYYGGRETAKYGNMNKTFWSRNIIISVSLLVTTGLFIVFRNELNSYMGLDVSFLVLIWLYISVVEDYLVQYFLAVKKQMISSMISVTAKFIYLIMILMFTFNVRTLIILNILSHATVLLYVMGINKKDVGKFEFDKEWFKEILNFSLWQLFGFSGLYLINFGDVAVIKHFMTIEDVGMYNAAYKLFNAIANFAFVISSYYAGYVTQIFEKKETKKIEKFFYRERKLIILLSVFIHVLTILFSKPFIFMFYGQEYIEAVPIFNILMIGSLFRYFSVFYTLYFNTNGKYKILQNINIFRAVLNIVLDIVFIKMFGLIGAAIATTIAIIICFVISALYCERNIKIASSRGDL